MDESLSFLWEMMYNESGCCAACRGVPGAGERHAGLPVRTAALNFAYIYM